MTNSNYGDLASQPYRDDESILGAEYFDPEHFLVGALLRAISNKQRILIADKNNNQLTVLSDQDIYYFHGDDLEAFCTAPANSFTIETLASGFKAKEEDLQQSRPLEDLLWNAGHHSSNGKLMKNCYRDDVIHLTDWPNLNRISNNANTAQLAAFFSLYPSSVTLATKILKIDPSEVYQFYSAAHSAGFVKLKNREYKAPDFKPHKNASFISVLLKKVSKRL